MKFLYIVLLLCISVVSAQTVDSRFFYLLSLEDTYSDHHTNFSYFKSDLNNKNISIKYTAYKGIVKYDQKYKDDNFLFLYSLGDTLNNKTNFVISAFIENSKVKPLHDYSYYYNDDFEGFSGDIQQSFIQYKTEDIAFKIGRDYFLPGEYLEDRLLFSANSYPYDQFIFTLIKNKFSISSFYLHLNDSSIDNISYKRHLNGHRINFNFDYGYIALSEIAVYGGENKNIHLPLLNPGNIFYVYQMNNNFNLNSIFSLEFLFDNNDYSIFFEFVLDDFQIEKDDSEDLEPTEFGLLFHLSKNFRESSKYDFTYSVISNRTFNAPQNIYEKMIYKNFPIGHTLGNNFWKVDNKFTLLNNNHIFSITHTYIEKGEEALFSDFNTDYLNYSISDGYSENFPFGEINVMSGLIFDYYFIYDEKIKINTSMSYWFQSYLQNKGFNFSISASYAFNY